MQTGGFFMSEGNMGSVMSVTEEKQEFSELTGEIMNPGKIGEYDRPLLSPTELLAQLPAEIKNLAVVEESRQIIKSILRGEDGRLLVIVGPCSIHDYDSALDYAKRLRQLSSSVSDRLYLVMRCYFEKPRTVTGWKGLINDPYLDESNDIATGLSLARRILLDITGLGVPVATEALEPNLSHYYQDLISWTAIGARTVESQLHRQFASGLASPVGIKNSTHGCIESAINALIAVRAPHCYAGINAKGQVSMVQTRGNNAGHIILRGGNAGPNYDGDSLRQCQLLMRNKSVNSRLIVDCSHANSGKNASRQSVVVENVLNQILAGENVVAGIMLEGHIKPGAQSLEGERKNLAYGVSVTDECLGWVETAKLLQSISKRLQRV